MNPSTMPNTTSTTGVATPEWAIVNRDDMPEIRRQDGDVGSWSATVVPATRGLPFTNFGTRHIAVPFGDSPTAKAVRHHELVHASISPTNLHPEVIRKFAVTMPTIALAEEVRVNYVLSERASKLGVDMKAMKDGTELRDAKAAVEAQDFVSALSLACATMFTGSERGVARELQARFPEIRTLRKEIKRHLARWSRYMTATSPYEVEYEVEADDPDDDPYTETTYVPNGFALTTIPLAQLLEKYLPREGEGHGDYLDRVKEQVEQGDGVGSRGVRWGDLIFGSVPLLGNGSGFLSRTRRASSMGRAPRRLHRLLTDPERRVFDRVARKSGGVVLVDGSGSMSLSSEDLYEIVKAAPGCLVAVYSYNGGDRPNIWIVADRGLYALPHHFPPIGSDNIVDLPALHWAIAQRKRKDDPVIWVSDGHVTMIDGGYHKAVTQVVDAVRKGKVTQVGHVSEAVTVLREASNGRRPETKLVGHLLAMSKNIKEK